MATLKLATAMGHFLKFTVQRQVSVCRAYVGLCALALLAGCGGGSDQTLAEQSNATVGSPRSGSTPFIASVTVTTASVEALSRVGFRIDAKPGASAKPVHSTFTLDYLQRQGYFLGDGKGLKLPLFGLYAGYDNQLHIDLDFIDGSKATIPVSYATQAYADPNSIYDHPVITTARTSQSPAMGFDFFFMKSALGSPVITDTDGNIRWIAADAPPSVASMLIDNGFIVGAGLQLSRLELDGRLTTSGTIQSTAYTGLQHNIDPGKTGILVEPDAVVDGQQAIESTLAEVDTAGRILKEWRFDEILTRHMSRAGDDPTVLVRPGLDWFHMNSALYDPTDDSIVVSSRENFVIKVDYQSGEIKWLFGDPTKYWFTVPSLRAKALLLPNGGLYPDGQHSISLSPSGDLVLFNNGQPSSYPPPGSSGGELRAFSDVASYAIDAASSTATQRWSFDHGQTIKSPFCSSAQQTPDGSVLISYATADNFAHAKLVGLSPQRDVVFEFQYDSTPCGTSWNAQVIRLDALIFD